MSKRKRMADGSAAAKQEVRVSVPISLADLEVVERLRFEAQKNSVALITRAEILRRALIFYSRVEPDQRQQEEEETPLFTAPTSSAQPALPVTLTPAEQESLDSALATARLFAATLPPEEEPCGPEPGAPGYAPLTTPALTAPDEPDALHDSIPDRPTLNIDLPCPKCGAPPGQRCRNYKGKGCASHRQRIDAWIEYRNGLAEM